MTRAIAALLSTILVACGAAETETVTAAETETEAETAAETELDARFEAVLLEAAAAYSSWGYVDERPNIAPMLCRMPTPADHGSPARARVSEAGPHGKKLYYLAAKDKGAYLAAGKVEVPVGQVIVKESWTAEAEDRGDPPGTVYNGLHLPRVRVARAGDRTLYTGDRAGLYIMIKMPAGTAGTDAGWIYGTVTAGGERVTSAGRVRQCMGCHERAPHGRLFGLKDGGAVY